MNLERLKTIHNGAKAAPTFSREEMDRRLGDLRKSLADAGLDAALFTSYHNVNYYSDFLYTAFGRPYGLVVTHDSHTTVSANIDAGQPWRRSHDENVVYTDWRRDNFLHAVRETLARAGVREGRLGIEDDTVPLRQREQLAEALGGELVDVSQEVMRHRMIKSEEEIALITEGARIADLGGAAVVGAVREGVPEYEVALAGTAAMVREIARSFPDAELRDTWVWFQSGINTDGAHNWPTSRTVRRGDVLSLNCFPMIAGYYTALERTLFLGEPDAATLRHWEVNTAVHRRGLELIRPGAVCGEIAAELNEIYAAEGLLANRTFGYGHSFGVLSHYYGREAGLELREDITTVLEPGMVVSIEPMITVPDGEPGAGGYREHDILVVEQDGARNITGFPFGPEHNVLG
ncbi:aminopeptidase P family protein [Actinomycetospora termitidis]|uniref:Aminopeptidase P family protein n=1 Tax=Actinomycetospora termitidis TaxID=3053470 RepID=A0ABT7M4M6_9PSEU|nr:aminopeptidase P family protein [Actinomycetospora sp. Odt1-22]MDL5155633.1 aminopeptidase P family protein [Actinomycetospora sp. Odt1-22]